MNLTTVKQRFRIIGNSKGLNRALDIAIQVAPSDLSVLITGESGTGKETIPQIIHQLNSRRHDRFRTFRTRERSIYGGRHITKRIF